MQQALIHVEVAEHDACLEEQSQGLAFYVKEHLGKPQKWHSRIKGRGSRYVRLRRMPTWHHLCRVSPARTFC